VIKREQARFDIAEICALKFAKAVNETDCPIVRGGDCFFKALETEYKKALIEFDNRQKDFALSWIGELSRQQYYARIEQELKQLLAK